jgi:hypothetical protein
VQRGWGRRLKADSECLLYMHMYMCFIWGGVQRGWERRLKAHIECLLYIYMYMCLIWGGVQRGWEASEADSECLCVMDMDICVLIRY